MTDRAERPAVPTRRLRLYLAAVVVVGAAVVVDAAFSAARTPQPLGWLTLAAMAMVAGSFRLVFAAGAANISIADTFFITIALLFGPGPAVLAIAAGGCVNTWRRRAPWRQVAFNTAAPAISLWIATLIFYAIARVRPLALADSPLDHIIFPLLWATAVYFVLNSGLVALAVGFDTRQSPATIWKQHFSWLALSYLAAGSASFCLVLLIQKMSLGAIAVVLPLVGVFYLTLRSSFGRVEDARRHLGDLDRLYLSTIETLAMAIDAKDDVTHSHVRRVQAYALALARALGVDDEQSIKAIKAAALLHDTGKLAVPEHILNKPGKLTASEFETMKLHVDVGADILSLVEFPYPVVPIVRCHHENWDGSGYPRGVKGEDIPIGARILSVVDCFDALTSDRPYRRAMTEEAAFAILRERSGSMYDPQVVETFIAIHGTIVVDEGDAQEHHDVLRRISTARAEPPHPDFPTLPSSGGASNDVLAFVSLARIASGEGSIADVLALSSKLVADLIPDATGAWYLVDHGRLRLTVADAFGPAAHVVRTDGMRIGERLSGWVAASRQPVVNSDAALDLESRVDEVSPPLRACMSVPLLMGETLLGVLSLYSPDAVTFDEHRGRLLQMIAPHIASAVHAASSAREAAPSADKGASTSGLRLVAAR
jgi:putative nucleotidyltransferase with HDIG domain